MGPRFFKQEVKSKYHEDEHHKRVKKIFEVLHLCRLTYRQEEIVASLEHQFIQRGSLTDKQRGLLSDLYETAETGVY